jgi:hypothetical protein
MVYTQQTWFDGPTGLTPITAATLTHIETGVAGSVSRGELVFNVQDYGAKGDGQRIRNVTASTASAVVTVASGNFSNADIGKVAAVYSDTAAGAITTIASVQSTTQVTLAANANITVTGTGGYFLYGSDDSTAFTAAFTAAAVETSTDVTVGPNQPQGLGQPIVLAPQTTTDSLYVLASAVTVPSGVMLDCAGMLVNATASLTTPVVTFNPYSSARRLYVECLFNSGIQLGSAAGTQADVHADKLVLWHVGKAASQVGLNLLGYGFLIDLVWMKGGNTGILHNAGSDCFVNRAFIIGAHTAISMSQSNQVRYNGIIMDSCGEVGGGYSGIVLDNACSYVTFNAQAFCVTGLTRSLDNVVLLGNGSTNKNVVLQFNVTAEKTGGNVVNFAQAQDVECNILASNTASNSSGGNNITTAVVFGTVAGSFRADAELSGTVTPYSGTVAGLYRYTRGGVAYSVQGGAGPTVAIGANNGSGGANTPNVTGNDARGKINFGSNTSPTAGAQVAVTFASSSGWVAAPTVIVVPTTSAAAALQLYVSGVSTTGFTVSSAVAPTGGQANSTYGVYYQIIG